MCNQPCYSYKHKWCQQDLCTKSTLIIQQSYSLVAAVQQKDLERSSVLWLSTLFISSKTTHKWDVHLCLSEALTDTLIDCFPNGQQEAVWRFNVWDTMLRHFKPWKAWCFGVKKENHLLCAYRQITAMLIFNSAGLLCYTAVIYNS